MSNQPPTPPPADPKTDPPAGTPPPNGEQAPGPVPYDRFKAVNDEKKKLETDLATLKAQLQSAQDAGKTELEKLTADFGSLKSQLEQERQQRLRLEIASKKGIPANLAGRLTGSTEAELEADAEALKAFLRPAEGPGNPPPSRPGEGRATGFDLAGKTPEEIRKAYADGKVKLTG